MTRPQAEVYDAVLTWARSHAHEPSTDDLMRLTGYGRTQVYAHLTALIQQGKLVRGPRGLQIVVMGPLCPTCGQAVSPQRSRDGR